MGLQPRTKSQSLEKAAGRINDIREAGIDADFSDAVNLETYEKLAGRVREQLQNYNASLLLARRNRDLLRHMERQLDDLTERMLAGVASRYGKDSDQYALAGGTKKSEIKTYRPQTFEPGKESD